MVYTVNMGVPSTIGRNLKRLRAERKLSLTDLANRSKVNRTYISHIENGRIVNPRLTMSYKLAEGLGVPLAELLREEQTEVQQLLHEAPTEYFQGDPVAAAFEGVLHLAIYDVPGTLRMWAALPERKQDAVADMIRFLWSEEMGGQSERAAKG